MLLSLVVSAFSRVCALPRISRCHSLPKTCQRKIDMLQPSSPLPPKVYIPSPLPRPLVSPRPHRSYLGLSSIITTGKSCYVASSPCASLSLFVTTEGPWTSSLSNPNRGPATHTKGREKGKGQEGARVYNNTPAGIKHNIASCSSWLVSIVLSSPCPHLLRW
jgi:hypothetical protein